MGDGIRTITVIAVGQTGWGIAFLSALAGYRTILEDLTGQLLGRALSEIRALAVGQVAAGHLTAPEQEAALARLEPQRALDEAAAAADLIVEAAPEDMETKIEVYTLIDRAAPPHCLFASATPGPSITELGSLTYRAPLVLGMRFPPPVTMTRRVELVRGHETSDGALAAAAEVARRMGKQIVRVDETPGGNTRRGVHDDGTPKHQTRES